MAVIEVPSPSAAAKVTNARSPLRDQPSWLPVIVTNETISPG